MGRTVKADSIATLAKCPRFAHCSVPICPLDLAADCRTRLPGEPSCTLAKSVRLRIGSGTDLPRRGLTKLEWAGQARWQGLSESERGRRLSNLRPIDRIFHGNHGSGQGKGG